MVSIVGAIVSVIRILILHLLMIKQNVTHVKL